MHDIICPRCRARHGPAATACDCGESLVGEEEPAHPLVYFVVSAACAGGAVGLAYLADQRQQVFFPGGLMLFSAVAFTLGVRSWILRWRNRGR